MKAVFGSNTVERKHWRRLVKNSGWANQNLGGQKVVKRDKCMGISHLLGHVPGLPPESTPMNGNVTKLGVQKWMNV